MPQRRFAGNCHAADHGYLTMGQTVAHPIHSTSLIEPEDNKKKVFVRGKALERVKGER